MDQEQSAYDTLKVQWPTLSGGIRSHCNQIATFGGTGSYSLLHACIEQETAAARANQDRGFKY
jgi:hypothetical protein